MPEIPLGDAVASLIQDSHVQPALHYKPATSPQPAIQQPCYNKQQQHQYLQQLLRHHRFLQQSKVNQQQQQYMHPPWPWQSVSHQAAPYPPGSPWFTDSTSKLASSALVNMQVKADLSKLLSENAKLSQQLRECLIERSASSTSEADIPYERDALVVGDRPQPLTPDAVM